jgi:hypothetical protein
MSDEAHFCMSGTSGYVNKHNCHYWAPNPYELHQHFLHSAKVTVWCAILSHDIIGPQCFEIVEGCTATVNADGFKVMLETFLQNELHFHWLNFLWLQQDGANCSHNRFPCKSWRQCFQADSFLVLGTSPGPPSPDLAVPDYFLWDYDKSKVYETCPANTDIVKQQIQECIQGIHKEMLQCVITAFPSRLQSVLNDMVVTYKVSYPNSYDLDEFSWTWNVPASVNNIFHFALKCYFISKTVRCLWHTLYIELWTYFLNEKNCLHFQQFNEAHWKQNFIRSQMRPKIRSLAPLRPGLDRFLLTALYFILKTPCILSQSLFKNTNWMHFLF